MRTYAYSGGLDGDIRIYWRPRLGHTLILAAKMSLYIQALRSERLLFFDIYYST